MTGESLKDALHILLCGGLGVGKTSLAARLTEGAKAISSAGATPAGAISFDGVRSLVSGANGDVVIADIGGGASPARNIVAGAPDCGLALLLVDVRHGVDTETRRQTFYLSLLGVRKLALVVNKMDLAGFAADAFDEITEAFLDFAKELGFEEIVCIPVSVESGDNLLTASNALSWYRGPALMAHLQMAGSAASAAARPLRIEIAEGGARSVEGRVVSGTVRRGAPLILLPACRETHVLRIATGGGEVQEAAAGTPVTLELADETGAMGGDMLADPESPPDVSDQIAAHVIWLDEEAMLPGRSYIIDCNGQQASATVGTLKHKINFDNLDHIAGPTLEQGEAGYCNLSIARPIIFDPYRDNGETGRFILIDRVSKAVAGVGMIEFGLRRATNISWQALDIDKGARAGQKGQRPCVLWFTGLSGSGKSTIANLLERRLHALGRHTYLLDGDNVRHGLNKDLGFTDADRVENIRRVAETAKLMADAGLIVMAAFISPFRSERRMARDLFEEGEFFEVFVDTPLGICEDRDPKGLYKKARAGEIKNFTGIDSDYEPPERADIHLDAGRAPAEDLVAELIEILQKSRFI